MLGFTPFKKHANKFNYIPRYYDPVKEARVERRAELRGERSEDAGREYRPGQYIRTQHAARAARRSREDNAGNMRIWKLAAVAVVATVFIYLLYPRLTALFLGLGAAPAPTEAAAPLRTEARDGFDQSHVSDAQWQEQPIVAVPNDYTE